MISDVCCGRGKQEEQHLFLPLLIKPNSLAVQMRKQSQWDSDLAEVKDWDPGLPSPWFSAVFLTPHPLSSQELSEVPLDRTPGGFPAFHCLGSWVKPVPFLQIPASPCFMLTGLGLPPGGQRSECGTHFLLGTHTPRLPPRVLSVRCSSEDVGSEGLLPPPPGLSS